jgi:phage shock protein PspC (stress-responsive transcriptional regulator)
MDETPTTTAPVPQASTTTIRRLTRRSEGKVIAGVCAGLGDSTGMDPVVFRIVFVVLALFGGAGFFVYLLGWVLIPLDTAPSTRGESLLSRLRGARWLPAVLIAGVSIFLVFQLTNIAPPVVWAIALLAIGVLLLRDEPLPVRAPAASSPAVNAPVVTPATVVPRVRSPLGLYTIGVSLLLVGLAAALQGAGALTLSVTQYVALAVTAVGAGLIVGAWWGRARLLILVGIILVPVMLISSVITLPWKGTVGDIYFSSRHLRTDRYDVLAGSITLDMARFQFGDTPKEVDVNLVLGHLRVYVPPGVRVVVDGTFDAGRARVFEQARSGFDVDFGGTFQRPGSTEGELRLNVTGGIAKVTMHWAGWVESEIRFRERQREKKARQERQERRESRDARERQRKDGN